MRHVLPACVVFLFIAASSAAAAEPDCGVEFDGLSTYAVVDDGPAVDFDAFTLAAWVKPRHLGGPQVLLNRGEAGGLFTLYLYNDRVRMLVEYKEGQYAHANIEIQPAGQWTHYAGTYDGQEIKLYVNGQLAHVTEAPGRIPESEAPLFLGALRPSERTLNGWLADPAVWHRALADDEIARLAQMESHPGLEVGLVARWNAELLAEDRWPAAGAASLVAKYDVGGKLLCEKDDGYRGIWYSNQAQGDEYVYKYSGGMGTYCAKHRPFAIYSAEANKTFFCYGGRPKDRNVLVHMVSYYDHETGQVPRPTILLNKGTDDAHDNPVISLDARGHVWIFSSSHGTARPSYLSVSTEPFSVDRFEPVLVTNFSYTQPYFVPGEGFLFLHTKYASGRCLYQMTSRDGRTWTEPERLAKIEMGHYQISWRQGNKVGTAFNFHPEPNGLNWRTNLYYMQTEDFGRTWQNAEGETIELPLADPENPTLVHNYQAEGRNVYLKDLDFDGAGRPVILYLTSGGWESGPENGPRTWCTARWTGREWELGGSIQSDNNYDMGSLYLEADDLWRIIGPTQPGPQAFNTGGEVAIWTSTDQGATWNMQKQLTHDSPRNHTYCRKPVDAHPDFYAFWADGHGRELSESRLYFSDRQGNVRMLPAEMDGPFARPEPLGPTQ